MSTQWKSIICFKDSDGNVLYGEPDEKLKKVTVYDGDDLLSLTRTERTAEVAEVLAPYVPDTILCIGLNYKAHAKEAGFALPKHPPVFQKSKNSIAGPFATIPMPPADWASNIDYENELCFVVSHDAKNISAEDAPNYILGYTVGNDVSSRQWQAPDMCSGQFSYAKNFDAFCPIGPAVVSPGVVDDPQDLKMETRRGGKVVQSSRTSDMIFSIKEILSFLSRGTTVPAGTLVMTGTPPGVAMFASKPPNFLKSGEVVECEIEKLGCLRNTFA
ncbi:hypothetical protein LTR53_011866 [Teratosphaeriaceae sp. CCFEE 6253]|nr:hypothetical protein LTR53_011866 [Teratosphaeriaceae sp. CCFEE 6253]